VGKRIEQVFKSLLGKSGYSEEASNEVWKWYTAPPKKNKTLKKKHDNTMPICTRKTREKG